MTGVGNWPRMAGIAGLLLCSGLAGLYAAHPLFSVDLFWHLALGEVIVRTHAIPTTDLFSAVAPDAHYVQFNWLWDVLAFQLSERFGLGALRIAQAALMAGSLGALYGWTLARTREASVALLLSAFALVLVEDRFRARPDALTFGFVVALLPIWTRGVGALGRRHFVALGVCAVLWSNIHGGASLLMLAASGALALGAFAESMRSAQGVALRRAGIGLLLVTLAGLACSPTLVAGVQHWGQTIGSQLSEGNEEWMPTLAMLRFGNGVSRFVIAVAPSVVGVLYVLEQLRRRRQHVPVGSMLGEWLLCAGMLLLSQQALRNAFLCSVPLAFMLLRAAAMGLGTRARALQVVLGVGLLGVSFQDAVVESYAGLDELSTLLALDVHPDEQPLELGAFIEEAGIEGGVLNDGRWGGYLIYRGWPSLHVFADSRHRFGPEALFVYRKSHDPVLRSAAAQQAYSRWGIELVAFADPTFAAGPPPGWALLYKAGPQELYQHTSGAHAARNFARARSWLQSVGARLPDAPAGDRALELAIARSGGALWLSRPRQQQRLRRARALLQSAVPNDRRDAEVQLALLNFHAGRDAEALQHLMALRVLDARDPRSSLYAALIHARAGETADAHAELRRISTLDMARLSAVQRLRLFGVARQLGAHAAVEPSAPTGEL